MSYRAEVQPILERRCVVCHGCYDSPCQLKLGAMRGHCARRSAPRPSTTAVASTRRRRRLGFSSMRSRPPQWRGKGFYRGAERARAVAFEANLRSERAVPHASPSSGPSAARRAEVLPKPFDFSLDRTQYVPAHRASYECYEAPASAGSGCPTACRGSTEREYRRAGTLARCRCALCSRPTPLARERDAAQIQAWETLPQRRLA